MGLNAEIQTAEWLSRQGWIVLFHRAKTKIAEIDLILQKENQIRLVEVKTLENSWRAFERVSHKQISKLIQNQILLTHLSSKYRISSWVAWVKPNGIELTQLN